MYHFLLILLCIFFNRVIIRIGILYLLKILKVFSANYTYTGLMIHLIFLKVQFFR